jgi:hypothetical protein
MSEHDIIKHDLERRIVERHKQWVEDSMRLFAMADFEFDEAQKVVASELFLRAANAFHSMGADPDRAGQLLATMLRQLQKKATSTG